MKSIYNEIIEAQQLGKSCALCIITKIKGSTPRKTGSKMLVYNDKSVFGSVGGGSFESKVIEDAINVINKQEPEYFVHDLLKDHSMGCGGNIEVYIEPINSPYILYIFGAGHIGRKLALYATDIGFKVTLIDERENIFRGFDYPEISTINLNYKQVFEKLTFGNRTFIASLSHMHGYDFDIIGFCAKQKFAYLGMIGSKRKIALAKKHYLENKILNEKQMDKIDWPMGVSISCETPEEIAVSILAKIIDVRGNLRNIDD